MSSARSRDAIEQAPSVEEWHATSECFLPNYFQHIYIYILTMIRTELHLRRRPMHHSTVPYPLTSREYLKRFKSIQCLQ